MSVASHEGHGIIIPRRYARIAPKITRVVSRKEQDFMSDFHRFRIHPGLSLHDNGHKQVECLLFFKYYTISVASSRTPQSPLMELSSLTVYSKENSMSESSAKPRLLLNLCRDCGNPSEIKSENESDFPLQYNLSAVVGVAFARIIELAC